MSIKVPAIFEDSTGTVARLTGELELPKGLPVSTAREQISGNPVSIADGNTTALTWDTKASGSDLLTLTAPAAPTVVTSGVYAVTVIATPAAITVGGNFTLALALDATGDDAPCAATSSVSTADNASPVVSCSLTYFVPAGGTITAEVTNNDGTASQMFSLAAIVQEL